MLDKYLSQEDLNLIGDHKVSVWAKGIRRGYALSFLLYTFHDLGVFEELKKGHKKSANELAKKLGLDKRLLEAGLNFFAHADNSLVKEGNNYYLTDKGRERIFADQTVAMALGAVGAYHCLFTHYNAALQGREKYCVNFERDGRLIAKASYLTGKSNYDWIINKLKDLGVSTVVDLGCGSGNILIDFCQRNKSLVGVGVDISQGALDEAKERIKKKI